MTDFIKKENVLGGIKSNDRNFGEQIDISEKYDNLKKDEPLGLDLGTDGRDVPVHLKTGTHLISKYGFHYCDTSGGDIILTLPRAKEWVAQYIFHVIKTTGDGNKVTIETSGSDLIIGSSTLDVIFQYNAPALASDGISNWYLV